MNWPGIWTVVTALSSCAHIKAQPASAPTAYPVGYIVMHNGQKVPDEGLFLSLADARMADMAQAEHDLSYQQAIADAELAQHMAESRLSKDEFWARYGLPVGGVAGVALGVVLGFIVGAHR